MKQPRYCTEEEIAEVCNVSNHLWKIVSQTLKAALKNQYKKILLDNFHRKFLSNPNIVFLRDLVYWIQVSFYLIADYHLLTKGRYDMLVNMVSLLYTYVIIIIIILELKAKV